MGEGAVYSFTDFSLGTMSDNCEEIDEAPCPEKWADLNYVPDEEDERSLFGFSIISTDNYNFISAPKSSTYARQSGVIYVYKNWFSKCFEALSMQKITRYSKLSWNEIQQKVSYLNLSDLKLEQSLK